MSNDSSKNKSDNASSVAAAIAKVLMIVGGALVLLIVIAGLFLLFEVFFVGGDGKEWLLFLAIMLSPIWICIPVIGVILFLIGLIIYLINKNKKNQDFYDTYIKDSDFKTSEINEDWDKGGTFKCPYCGREQEKNTFECIYCHHKI